MASSLKIEMYKGTPLTRANRENLYFKDSVESSKLDFQTFIQNVRYVLKHIGISYETLCRIIDAEGVRVNKDYPARVQKGNCLAPTLIYCNFFSKKINVPLYKLLSPEAEFKSWFNHVLERGEYNYTGPIVKFKGRRSKGLSIMIKQGGLVSIKGLRLDMDATVTGGRIREILKEGTVLNLGKNPNETTFLGPQKIYLKAKGSPYAFNGKMRSSCKEPERVKFNDNL